MKRQMCPVYDGTSELVEQGYAVKCLPLLVGTYHLVCTPYLGEKGVFACVEYYRNNLIKVQTINKVRGI